MGRPVYGQFEFYKELTKIIDLPDGIVELDIRIRPDEVPTVTAVLLLHKLVPVQQLSVDHDVYHEEPHKVKKRFRLEEIEPLE